MNLKEKIKLHKWELGLLFALFVGGVFLRTYNFTPWLHFEIDQAYDFNTVSPALEKGTSYLPLFGTNVGGGLLRLGPAFYYMEYLSALFFGNTPPGHAMAVLLLSIAALPLFYVFCRRYFSVAISLGLEAIFAFSLFSVMYARFSWSPNVLPFLLLLSFYALLRSVSLQEKHPARWFLVAVAAVTITSQIHFNSFFVVPGIALVFTLIKRPRFPWKVWLAAMGLVFLIYAPVIASDLHTSGKNLGYFQEKFQKTGTSIFKPKALLQTAEYMAYGSFFIVTGNDQINGIKLSGYGFDCKACLQDLPLKIAALLFFALGALSMFWRAWREKDRAKKDFLILSILWLLFAGYMFYTIAKVYRMYPRFYLIISPLSIILLGFLLQHFKPQKNKLRLGLLTAFISLLCFFNLQKIMPVFTQLGSVTTSANKDLENGDIFPNTNRLTYAEELRAIDYITSVSAKNDFPVYVGSKDEYNSAYWALLEKSGFAYYDEFAKKNIYAQANYFVIKFADERQNIDERFDVIEKKDLQTLLVYHLQPKAASITAQRQNVTDKKISKDNRLLPMPPVWHDLWQKK